MRKQLAATEMLFFMEDGEDVLDKESGNQDALRGALTERQLMKQKLQGQCSLLGHV